MYPLRLPISGMIPCRLGNERLQNLHIFYFLILISGKLSLYNAQESFHPLRAGKLKRVSHIFRVANRSIKLMAPRTEMVFPDCGSFIISELKLGSDVSAR